MSRPKKDTDQLSLRIPTHWLEEADALIPYVSRPGQDLGRTDIVRMAIALGFEVLHERYGSHEELLMLTKRDGSELPPGA